MTTTQTLIGGTLAAIVLLLGSILVGVNQAPDLTLGQAKVAATPRIATTTTVGPQGAAAVKTQIFAANSSCKSRIISTVNGAIMISFDDIPGAGNVGSTTVSGTVGSVQGASSTVAYDAELFGCGTWNAWASASTTITTVELQ